MALCSRNFLVWVLDIICLENTGNYLPIDCFYVIISNIGYVRKKEIVSHVILEEYVFKRVRKHERHGRYTTKNRLKTLYRYR